MKKILNLALLLMACFVISSCTDDEMNTQAPVARDYQTDAQILEKFVDVNKTVGEYYINEDKKNSPLAYISDKDWQELQLVNPVNRARYENELKALNAQLEIAAQRPDVSQIVYTTYGETWIRDVSDDSSIMLKKNAQSTTKSTRSSYGRLGLLYNSEQWQSFYAGNQIRMRINVNLYSYTYYFFEIICNTDARKSGSTGGSDPKKVVMSGTTSMESWEFTWTENKGSSKVFWEFRGKRNAPQDFNAQITAEFYD